MKSTKKKLPSDFVEGLAKIPDDEFAQKHYRPENKVYNLINGKNGLVATEPVETKDGRWINLPISGGFQIIILPDGTIKGRKI
jgi:hypothetical protein